MTHQPPSIDGQRPDDLGATAIAEAVGAGRLSAVEVTEAFLRRIESRDGGINAFVTVDGQRALDQARTIDDALAAGDSPGPLAGVPVAVKDIIVTEGMRTTCGSRMLADWTAPYDATVIERLRRAGAVMLGKTNMDEFAMGSSTEHSAFGACHNPWDVDRVPGGSSGGSAAAVSAGLCAAALGTDTGGSIRQPAACCGVVGLKPTYGRVSRYGVIAFASSLDQVGPLGVRVEDCATLLEIIAGHDPHDATSLNQPVGDYLAACRRGADGSLGGTRVGVPREFFGDEAGAAARSALDPRVKHAVTSAIDALAELGAEVVPISLPHTPHAVATYYLICMAEASSNLARFDGVRFGHRADDRSLSLPQMYSRTRHEGFGAEVKRRIMLGTFALSAGYYDQFYGKAQRVRTLIRRDFEQAWQRCDAIVTPTSPSPAFAIGERTEDPLQMYLADVYTTSCNLAGLPGLSMPCGFTDDARPLPIGLQLLGPPLGEEAILQLAAAYEAATGWHRRRPPTQPAPATEEGGAR